jgi:hypothetical protein
MRKLLFATALAASTLLGCSRSEDATAAPAKGEKLIEMTLDEVEQGIAANKLKAVDCNGDGARKKMGVVPGAILITDDESFAASELPADKSTKLVFYCANTG